MDSPTTPPRPGPFEWMTSVRTWVLTVLRKSIPSKSRAGTAAETDPLLAFSSEGADSKTQTLADGTAGLGSVTSTHGNRTPWIIGASLSALLAVAIVAFFELRAGASRTMSPEPGKFSVDSRPSGVPVSIDGEDRGITPLVLALKPGPHSMVLRPGGDRKIVPLMIVAGREMVQYYEFASAASADPPVPLPGRLTVTSDPSGARVQIDGRARGSAPVIVADLAPGEHIVSVSGEGAPIERKVSIEPGGAASVMFSLPKTSGPSAGWLTVSAPFEVQVFEDKDLVSASGAKTMLMSGRHELRLVAANLGYEETRRVEIAPGKVATLKINPPMAPLSANAKPWADVSVDGAAVGQTPLANLSVPIGPHQVIFRHPQFGEQRQTIVVTAKGPNRISVDLTKK